MIKFGMKHINHIIMFFQLSLQWALLYKPCRFNELSLFEMHMCRNSYGLSVYVMTLHLILHSIGNHSDQI